MKPVPGSTQKRYARVFGLVFAVTLVAGVAVTFVWNVLLNPEGTVDWGASFRLALILAFIAFVALTVWFVFFSGYPVWLRRSLVAVGLAAAIAAPPIRSENTSNSSHDSNERWRIHESAPIIMSNRNCLL